MRRLKAAIELKVDLELEDESNTLVFEYLVNKRLISGAFRKKGRYRGIRLRHKGGQWRAERADGRSLDSLPVYVVDMQMADPAVPSTTGVPTPENAEEVLELARQMRLIVKGKNTWSAAGHAAYGLRTLSAPHLVDPDNPFILGMEGLLYFRQILAVDGLLLREVLREAVSGGDGVSRDAAAATFQRAVSRAVDLAQESRLSPYDARELREFSNLVDETARKRSTMSRAPGVLEHRVTPRLEWLVDLGYLAKDPKERNRYEYRIESSAAVLLDRLDELYGKSDWCADVASLEWTTNRRWQPLRSKIELSAGLEEAVERSYRMLRRVIGPVPLSELAFAASLLLREQRPTSSTRDDIIALAGKKDGMSLSGGRYTRLPENVYITDQALRI